MGKVKDKAEAGDTYHNRYSPDSPYKGNKDYKKLAKKCAVCGTTTGPFDLHHTSNNREDLKSGKGLRVLCRSCHRKLHAKLNGGKGALIVSNAARIIDDPKTMASQAIAKEHKNSDLMFVEYILCHEGANANKDRFLTDDMIASAHTAINKPVNWEHTLNNIGVIVESKFVSAKNIEEEAKAYYSKIDPLEKDFIVCKAVLWEYKHPNECRVMRERADASKLFFSMENLFGVAKCSVCGGEFSSVFDYCDHLLNRRQSDGTDRIFVDSNFVGAAVAKVPADSYAGTLSIAGIVEEDMLDIDIDKYNKLIINDREGDAEMGDKVITVVDRDSKEFQEALASALDKEVEKLKLDSNTEAMKAELAKAKEEFNSLNAKVTEADKEKEAVAKELADFKTAIAQKEIAIARMDVLTEKGIAVEDNKEFVNLSIASMNEDTFHAFIGLLEEVKEIAVASVKVTKTEEKDPVKESAEVAIASKVTKEDGDKESSVIDQVLKNALGME